MIDPVMKTIIKNKQTPLKPPINDQESSKLFFFLFEALPKHQTSIFWRVPQGKYFLVDFFEGFLIRYSCKQTIAHLNMISWVSKIQCLQNAYDIKCYCMLEISICLLLRSENHRYMSINIKISFRTFLLTCSLNIYNKLWLQTII